MRLLAIMTVTNKILLFAHAKKHILPPRNSLLVMMQSLSMLPMHGFKQRPSIPMPKVFIFKM
jgi:hypothetical protein